ncbi:hypothetical protein N7481_006969 [Penicillium waksmanii]|uniref:uncharacterized protein n=1 Tax=Penicillium waksmanii TaxID=69791 RepID=UPI0025486602|nr:uncharacterized protein N7481_006969 [Penicillium waksmanii]KAJ5979671.1 hypothetical protein N7481_006969 [Penicillium waksmanii]
MVSNIPSGGGIAGIYLADLLESNDPGLTSAEVTIFEKEPQIGGRIGKAYRYDARDSSWTSIAPTDSGAYMFDSDDEAIGDMVRRTSSEDRIDRDFFVWSRSFGTSLPDRASTWDGQTLNLNPTDRVPLTWENVARTLSRHALSPKYWWNVFHSLKESINGEYIEPLLTSCRNWKTGQEWEEYDDWITFQLLVKSIFIRARPGPDKDLLSEFTGHYFIGSKPQSTLDTGIGVLLDDVVKQLGRRTNFSLNLQSAVTKLIQRPDSAWDAHWTFQSPHVLTENHNGTFDSVIIAAPFGQASLRFEQSLPITPDNISYTSLHVTNFLTERPLDHTAFNMSLDYGEGPNLIWNVQSDGVAQPGNPCSTPPFISITRLFSDVGSGCVSDYENLYRVVSKDPFSDDDIAALMKKCGKARESVTFPDQSCYKLNNGYSMNTDPDLAINYPTRPETRWMGRSECVDEPWIRWVGRKFWPYALPVVEGTRRQPGQDDQLELAPGLFYVSGFEGRHGASLSESTNSARRIKDMLLSKYLKIQDGHPQAGSDVRL